MNQLLDSQKTPNTSPYRASYRVSFVNICEEIDRVITAPHCIMLQIYNARMWQHVQLLYRAIYSWSWEESTLSFHSGGSKTSYRPGKNK